MEAAARHRVGGHMRGDVLKLRMAGRQGAFSAAIHSQKGFMELVQLVHNHEDLSPGGANFCLDSSAKNAVATNDYRVR